MGLVKFLRRRRDHKRIVARARRMRGVEYYWPPGGGFDCARLADYARGQSRDPDGPAGGANAVEG